MTTREQSGRPDERSGWCPPASGFRRRYDVVHGCRATLGARGPSRLDRIDTSLRRRVTKADAGIRAPLHAISLEVEFIALRQPEASSGYAERSANAGCVVMWLLGLVRRFVPPDRT